ncbi:hypothetical protein KSC_003370 [Ktedonobacter sp. SOSP1-52]|nr:hypothetical protein KSC_003370 [Ktedonobacter sp. SOSP1-52]
MFAHRFDYCSYAPSCPTKESWKKRGQDNEKRQNGHHNRGYPGDTIEKGVVLQKTVAKG